MLPLAAEWTTSEILWTVAAIVSIGALIFAVASYGALYARALLAGCHVSVASIGRMKLRGVSPHAVIGSRLVAARSGIWIDMELLESHYLARGNVRSVVRALIA